MKKNIALNRTRNQQGGGVEFDIYYGNGICINRNSLDSNQKKTLDQIVENISNYRGVDLIVVDSYVDDPAWIFLCAEQSRIPRKWSRFPQALSARSRDIEFDGYTNITMDPLCIRLDWGTEFKNVNEIKKFINKPDPASKNDKMNNLNKELQNTLDLPDRIIEQFLKRVQLVNDDKLVKSYKMFLDHNLHAINAGEWLVFTYS